MSKKFSIAKLIDINKLHHEIYDYINNTGKENFCLFMNKSTFTIIFNEIGLPCKYDSTTSEGITAVCCGFKTYFDNKLNFGEVEIRE